MEVEEATSETQSSKDSVKDYWRVGGGMSLSPLQKRAYTSEYDANPSSFEEEENAFVMCLRHLHPRQSRETAWIASEVVRRRASRQEGE